MHLIRSLFISLSVILLLPDQGSGSGVFQIQPLVFLNDFGVDEGGNCCTGSRDRSRCSGPCRTYFHICLSHYQSNLPADVTCTFGKIQTTILGDNSIHFAVNKTINIPFEFTWPGSFTLIVEAWHKASPSAAYNAPSQVPPDRIVFRIAILGTVDAGSGWHPYSNASTDIHSFSFRFRVICNETYFGPGCSDTCQPRDDKFGHYTCSPSGAKICQNGWTGQYCDKAVCLEGCHPTQGFCEDPFECKCRLGWQGKFCRQCIPYPGCQRGSCKAPWQCNCDEGWGGLFCNQDLNFCTNYHPCRNGGTCTNAGQGSYSCACPPGFTGNNCERETEDCDRMPCQNGGTCQLNRIHQLRCSCPPNYYGVYCQWNLQKSCDFRPCLNNGTCSEYNGQYHCLCPTDFTGLNCETKLDSCSSNPCLNGGRCITTSGGSDFACLCANGNSGQFCQDDHNHCAGSPCLNGATCVSDKSEGFVCKCLAGFVGVLCQDDVDDCLNYPCANGATCVDMVNDFRCACAVGFSGRYCSENVTSCAMSPCKHRGTCIQYSFGFKCLCVDAFHGEFCEIDGATVPLLVATPDKQVFGDVTSGVNLKQIVLIVVLGVGLPVVFLLLGVVLLIVKKRRRHDDVTGGHSNIRNDDVINCNKIKMADATEATASDLTTGRTLKITNKERQQMQCDKDGQQNIYASGQSHRFNESDGRNFPDRHVTMSGDRTLTDCISNKQRTRYHDDSTPTEVTLHRPFTVEGRASRSRDKVTNQPHLLHNYVLATEV